VKQCRICGRAIEPFLSFGKMPRGNGFLLPGGFPTEYFFNLEVAFCPNCTMVQLTEQPERERMFNGNYPFFSGGSQGMALHFKQFAQEVMTHYLASPDAFLVEIGSNDGTMLAHFSRAGVRHLGVEPSSNVARVARERGLQTRCDFFDEDLARQIVEEHGRADAIVGANVLCHISDLHSVAEGIKILLKPGGVTVFEDPYLGDVIQKTSYDQFYDEHVYLFSVSSISYLLEQHGMEIVDLKPVETHGGSMRFTAAHQGSLPVSPAVSLAIEKEKGLEFHRPETYHRFRKRCEKSRDQLMSLLHRLRKQGKRIVGYGATSKSTTIINYGGITSNLVEFICDTTPFKQGKFSPGAHIPVRPHEEFVQRYPDVSLLFAWNHQMEIMEKEKEFRRKGGQWLLYVPEVKVLAPFRESSLKN